MNIQTRGKKTVPWQWTALSQS